MDRRQLLGSLALIGVTAACANETSSEGEGSAESGGSGSGDATVVAAAPSAATLPPSVFGLGVASGDPLADGVILWTRLAAWPAATMPAQDVEVAFDVAQDEGFEQLVVSDVAVARPELAHSVHVDVSGLEPDTWYFYRFRAGDQTSETGRTRTLPAADAEPEQVRFVFASCQDLQWGHYAAWGRAVEQPDVDAVVFLGDYIYESNFGDLSPTKDGSRVWATAEALTLEDYRTRYAQTKADEQLRAAHAMAPWIVTFDDHEVSNNYAGDVGQADIDQPLSRDRRLAAYQAWYEHQPVRIDPGPDGAPEDFAELEVQRAVSFGTLLSLFSIETRQHADVPPCRTDGSLVADEGPGCEEQLDPARTNLGEAQEDWLVEGLRGSRTRWNVIANPLMLAGLNVGTAESPAITRDTWDGYPVVRERLLTAITDAAASNPVVVTGDWHASFVLDVHQTPTDVSSPVVMPEFVAGSISTIAFAEDYSPANPHVRYFDAEHGFGLVTVTPEQLTCAFHYIVDEWDPASPLAHVDTFVVADGERSARPV
jgi:alkaline phosphatase D